VDALRSLAREAQAGNGPALRRLIEAVTPSVLRLARTILGPDRGDAEDVAQVCLLAFVEALPAFRGESTILHYAVRIAARCSVAARRRAVERGAAAAAFAHASDNEDETVPGEPALAARQRNLVRRLLDELPEEQAETLALRVILGCSLQEVADATGAPVNTVRSRMRVAKETLRRRIEEEPELAELLEAAG